MQGSFKVDQNLWRRGWTYSERWQWRRARKRRRWQSWKTFLIFLFLLQFDGKSNDASSTGDRTFYSRTNCYGPTRKNRINPYQQPGDAGFAWSDRELDETDEAALANLSLVTIRLMSIFLRSRHCCLTAMSCYSNSAAVSHSLSFFFHRSLCSHNRVVVSFQCRYTFKENFSDLFLQYLWRQWHCCDTAVMYIGSALRVHLTSLPAQCRYTLQSVPLSLIFMSLLWKTD